MKNKFSTPVKIFLTICLFLSFGLVSNVKAQTPAVGPDSAAVGAGVQLCAPDMTANGGGYYWSDGSAAQCLTAIASTTATAYTVITTDGNTGQTRSYTWTIIGTSSGTGGGIGGNTGGGTGANDCNAETWGGPRDAGNGKVTICHNTHSETNPSVIITISKSALKAHAQHGDNVGF